MEIVESKESFDKTKAEEGGEIGGTDNDSFFFEYLEDKLEDQKEVKKFLEKWGLLGTLHAYNFRFNLRFQEINPDAFLIDLFNNDKVRSLLKDVTLPSGLCTKVTYKKLRCSLINLELFNKLDKEPEVLVASSKYIKKMLEEDYGEIVIGDKLRELLLKEECEHYEIFTDEDRSEFLFKVFQSVVLGGSICQYEDYLTEYLNVTRQIYKTIVNARKDSKTNQIFIESLAYLITQVDGKSVFTNTENPQNFLIVLVSPSLRQVCIYTNKWKSFW